MTGRWLLPAGDTGKVTWTVTRTASGPLGEVCHGSGITPLLQYRDLASIDEVIAAYVAMRADYGHEQARHEARQADPRPASMLQPVTFADEPLIDPDCQAGKHAGRDTPGCVGGPCECFCHEPGGVPLADDEALAPLRAKLAERPADLPHRQPGTSFAALAEAVAGQTAGRTVYPELTPEALGTAPEPGEGPELWPEGDTP